MQFFFVLEPYYFIVHTVFVGYRYRSFYWGKKNCNLGKNWLDFRVTGNLTGTRKVNSEQLSAACRRWVTWAGPTMGERNL